MGYRVDGGLPGDMVETAIDAGEWKGKKREAPLFVKYGQPEDPLVFVGGGMHGDEVNGMELVSRFLERLERDRDEMKCTVLVMPVINPWGFREGERRVPYDDTDINRSFPGDPEGNFSQRYAHTLFSEVLRLCSFAFDFHDAGRRNVLLPHPRIHMKDPNHLTRVEGVVFGTEVIMERMGAEGMMAIEAGQEQKLPVLTVEIGGGGVLWPDFIEQGIAGIHNVLRYLRYERGKPRLPPHQFMLSNREGYKAPHSGIVTLDVELGDRVTEGQEMGVLHNPVTGKETILEAEGPGLLFSKKLRAKVNKGARLYSLLTFEHCDINGVKPINGQMFSNSNYQGIAHGVSNDRVDLEESADLMFQRALSLDL